MAKVSEHCQDCLRELGDSFEQVNEWLDELFQFVGSDHRDIRHNVAGVEKVRKMWGDRAAQAAEIHIKADENGKIPIIDEAFKIRLAIKPHICEAFIVEYENSK
jgi:hypothetical protein